MASRSAAWLRIYRRAARNRLAPPRRSPGAPRRVLLPHHSLLGDTVLLTATVAKLRARHPDAEIVHVMPVAFTPLFEQRPYGVEALGWNPRDPASLDPLFGRGPFDIAYVNGDARYSWLALAMGASEIVAFDGDRPAYKRWPVTRSVPLPATPMSWSDFVTTLVPGPAPRPFARGDWVFPACRPFAKPGSPYAILHVGASTVHKLWEPSRWAQLATHIEKRGITPVWSGGPGEEPLVAAIPGHERFASYAGALEITQLPHFFAGARVIVSGDTSVAHLGRAVFAPTAILFGPGSPVLGGSGEFWKHCPTESLCEDPFECRDQTTLFKREVAWIRRCARTLAECPRARCMDALSVAGVAAAVDRLLGQGPA